MTDAPLDYGHLQVSDALPSILSPKFVAEPALRQLVGAQILRMGAPNGENDIEGGGLVLDYIPAGSSTAQRLVFAFNDAGMWIVYDRMSEL